MVTTRLCIALWWKNSNLPTRAEGVKIHLFDKADILEERKERSKLGQICRKVDFIHYILEC